MSDFCESIRGIENLTHSVDVKMSIVSGDTSAPFTEFEIETFNKNYNLIFVNIMFNAGLDSTNNNHVRFFIRRGTTDFIVSIIGAAAKIRGSQITESFGTKLINSTVFYCVKGDKLMVESLKDGNQLGSPFTVIYGIERV